MRSKSSIVFKPASSVIIGTLLSLAYVPFSLAGSNHHGTFPYHYPAHPQAMKKQMTVAADSDWELTATICLDQLTLETGASISAPDGYSVTLTVNGIETGIEEDSSYKGNVVLTLTEEIPITFNDNNYDFRTAVYIEDGSYVAEKSVPAAVTGGRISDDRAEQLRLISNGEKFNGIMVTSSSDSTDEYSYTIDHPVIHFSGNGGNDFAGYGAAIMSSGYADVTVNQARIINTGPIRPAVFASGNSTMTVNHSYIQTRNGTLPEDYEFQLGAGMMEVPWMLGITGNVRATLATRDATAYFIDSDIKTQAWGALSTDDVSSTKLYCFNSNIQTEESGYGAYADNGAVDYFSHCHFDVTDYGLIMTNSSSSTFTDHSRVKSGRFGVMFHSNGSGTLTINDGSVFDTEDSVIQAKGSFPAIVADNARLTADNGIILQLMANDDPYMASMGGSLPGSSSSASAAFSNMKLNGDLINGNTASGELLVNLVNSSITGAITTANTTFQYEADGYSAEDLTADDYAYIGQVINEYADTDDDYGVSVSLDADSAWYVDNTSYLTELTLDDGATLMPAAGYQLTMTVDGVTTAVAAGHYQGKIVLQVAAM